MSFTSQPISFIGIKQKKNSDFAGRSAIFTIRLMTYLVLLIMLGILFKIIYEGIEIVNWNFLTESPRNNMTEGGIGPAIFGTLSVTIIMVLFAVPLGVFTAIYINEYARDKWFARLIKLSVNNLAGVPSIIFGLFGLGFFILTIGKGMDEILNTGLLFGKPAMLWAAITLGVLVLPIIIVSTTEALAAVPDSQRYAAMGFGATKWQMIKNVVFPQARPGILTGIILSVSRAAGETAPILFLGCAFFLPDLPIAYLDFGIFQIPMINPAEQFMYLSYHIFILTTQSANPTETLPVQYGTTFVLILITLLLNITAVIFRYRFRKTLSELRGV